jgi:hypothetical protein
MCYNTLCIVLLSAFSLTDKLTLDFFQYWPSKRFKATALCSYTTVLSGVQDFFILNVAKWQPNGKLDVLLT